MDSDNTHGLLIKHGLQPGWLWPFKLNEDHATALKAHRRRWEAQYMQAPKKRSSETALWNDALIAKARESNNDHHLSERCIVGIDPATTNTESSDDHGIIVGKKYPGACYELTADYTRKGSPLTWAEAAMSAVEQNDADAIIIETNQGGDLCEQNLRNAGYKGRIIRVHAKKGKALRAEPVVALYELGQVSHNAGLHKMETEMLDFDPVTQLSDGKSPNRVDALVYVLTELAGIGNGIGTLMDQLYK